MTESDWVTLWFVLAIFSPIPLFGLFLMLWD